MFEKSASFVEKCHSQLCSLVYDRRKSESQVVFGMVYEEFPSQPRTLKTNWVAKKVNHLNKCIKNRDVVFPKTATRMTKSRNIASSVANCQDQFHDDLQNLARLKLQIAEMKADVGEREFRNNKLAFEKKCLMRKLNSKQHSKAMMTECLQKLYAAKAKNICLCANVCNAIHELQTAKRLADNEKRRFQFKFDINMQKKIDVIPLQNVSPYKLEMGSILKTNKKVNDVMKSTPKLHVGKKWKNMIKDNCTLDVKHFKL